MSPLHRETLTVLATVTGAPDDDGVPVATATPRPWGRCNVQQAATSETRGGREVTVERLSVSGPLARWITEEDQILRDGVTYRVEGHPAHFVGGALDHTELVAYRIRGE